jgi:hypothetical protein
VSYGTSYECDITERWAVFCWMMNGKSIGCIHDVTKMYEIEDMFWLEKILKVMIWIVLEIDERVNQCLIYI